MLGNYTEALYEADRSLLRNWHNPKARTIKAAILKRMGRHEEANELCVESLKLDKFNYGCLFISGNTHTLVELMHGSAHNYDETALEFCAAGLWSEAEAIWDIAIKSGATTPMTYYYRGWCQLQAGNAQAAQKTFAEIGRASCRERVYGLV